MKRLILALSLLLVGCESSTQFGKCVDITKDHADPKLEYELSTRNVILGVVFIQTIFAPLIVALSETYCPTGIKAKP
jgi:hypothetical protein